MFEDDTWILVLIGAAVLAAVVLWLAKQRGKATTRRRLQDAGFSVTHFYSSIVPGAYLAIDHTAKRVAVRGPCQDAAGFVAKVSMSRGEAVFSAARIEFAEINRELDLIEISGRAEDGRMLIVRISLQDQHTQDDGLAALRALGIGPSERMDIVYE